MRTKIITIPAASIFLIFGIAALVAVNPYGLVRLHGEAMTPTIQPNELVLYRKTSTQPSKGDVILFRIPSNKEKFIMRIIGSPGDTVEAIGNRIYVNESLIGEYDRSSVDRSGMVKMVSDGSFFVSGDNFKKSKNSFEFGLISHSEICGIAVR